MKLPFSTFAQQSSGIGARFVGSLWKQRLTWEAGIDRSVSAEGARDSDYEDVSLQILRNIPITKRIKSSWTLTYRGERLDASFESIGAFVQPDRAQRKFEASGNIGAFQFVLNHGRFEDNLNQTEFQWKTYTHQTSLMAELPFREFLGVKKDGKKWLPRITYTYFGLRNFSTDPPKGAEPDEGATLPDQKTEAHSVSIGWGRKTRIGYRFSFDGQAGYRHFTHTAVYAFQWANKLEVSGEAGIEQSEQTDSQSFAGRI